LENLGGRYLEVDAVLINADLLCLTELCLDQDVIGTNSRHVLVGRTSK